MNKTEKHYKTYYKKLIQHKSNRETLPQKQNIHEEPKHQKTK
jgi:hypothetical protein